MKYVKVQDVLPEEDLYKSTTDVIEKLVGVSDRQKVSLGYAKALVRHPQVEAYWVRSFDTKMYHPYGYLTDGRNFFEFLGITWEIVDA